MLLDCFVGVMQKGASAPSKAGEGQALRGAPSTVKGFGFRVLGLGFRGLGFRGLGFPRLGGSSSAPLRRHCVQAGRRSQAKTSSSRNSTSMA